MLEATQRAATAGQLLANGEPHYARAGASVEQAMAYLEWLLICVGAVSTLGFLTNLLIWRATSRPAAIDPALLERLLQVQAASQEHSRALREETALLRDEHGRQAAALREEVVRIVAAFQGALEQRFGALAEDERTAATALRKELTEGQTSAAEAVARSTASLGEFQRERLAAMETAQKAALELVEAELKRLGEANAQEQEKGRQTLTEQLEAGRKDGEGRQEKMRETLTQQLDQLRKENEAKLEQMRVTVDEKLQGTLEQRLGESFKLVQEQLATVHTGLGEMQKLATDVGGLQRVLTNVRARGGWGEVQLSRLIEDRFTPDQYAQNFRPRPTSQEVVEYAIKLPGREEEGCYIPIDSKFPSETYERLLAAQEKGDAAEIERTGRNLDQVIRNEALRICKYLQPPRTTDFAVMFLPTEGLFAEVIRRPGLFDELQRDRRVTVTGPTTLSAFLTSLDLGFRTLQIEKRASEVWQVLGAAKLEFTKYGAVWEKLEKQLDTAKNTVVEAGRRTRAVERRLREVETTAALEGNPTDEDTLKLLEPETEPA